MGFIANIQKKRAIKSYINKLGKDLAKRYGKSKKYTSAQVVKTVQDEGYIWRHICYAHALYTSAEQFMKWHEEQGESCDYEAMREEITENYFHGNAASFEAASCSEDVLDYAAGGDVGSHD